MCVYKLSINEMCCMGHPLRRYIHTFVIFCYIESRSNENEFIKDILSLFSAYTMELYYCLRWFIIIFISTIVP